MNPTQFRTGDLFFFTPQDYQHTWLDNLILFFTNSKYCHVSMVVVDPDFPNFKSKGVYLLQSCLYSCVPDSENHQLESGVQFQTLEEILTTWPGGIYWRKLHCLRDQQFYDKLIKAHQQVHHKSYDQLWEDWIQAGLGVELIGNQRRTNTFWCSALVAYIYTQLGLLPASTPWTLITPKLLGTEWGWERKVSYQNCLLDSEVLIK